MADWRDRVISKSGESLRIDDSCCDGFMQEKEVYSASIIDSTGVVVGKVEATDHTAIRGFRRTLSVRQTDVAGKVVVDETWTA
jgi:hypothetical protein